MPQPNFLPVQKGWASACSDAPSVPENIRIEQALARAEIRFYGDAANVYNAGVAAGIVNGTVLWPGQVFSFNETVGVRSKDRGFIIGQDIYHHNVFGGGVCRTATVLYQTARAAGLEIVERHPHGLPVAYTEPGTDATVSWGSLDLKFANNTPCALSIYAGLERKDGAQVLWSALKESRDFRKIEVLAAKGPFDPFLGRSVDEVRTCALVADGISYISIEQLSIIYGLSYSTESQGEFTSVKINYKQPLTFSAGRADADLGNATVPLPGKPFSLPECSGLWVPLRFWADLTGSEVIWKDGGMGNVPPFIYLKLKQT